MKKQILKIICLSHHFPICWNKEEDEKKSTEKRKTAKKMNRQRKFRIHAASLRRRNMRGVKQNKRERVWEKELYWTRRWKRRWTKQVEVFLKSISNIPTEQIESNLKQTVWRWKLKRENQFKDSQFCFTLSVLFIFTLHFNATFTFTLRLNSLYVINILRL